MSGVPQGARARSAESPVDLEIDEELAFHLEQRALAFELEGHSPAEARRLAATRFGDLDRIRRACLAQRNWRRIVLQRLHLATTLVLLIGASLLAARGWVANSAQASQIRQLNAALEELRRGMPLQVRSDGEEDRVFPPRTDMLHLAVGDVIRVQDPSRGVELEATVPVAADGMLLLPEIGWIEAAGKTLEQLDAELSEAYAPYFIDPVHVTTALEWAAKVRRPVDPDLLVQAGDRLTIADVAHPAELAMVQAVRPDGTLLLPELGRIHVAGISRVDLESLLTASYAQYYATPPRVFVQIGVD